MRIAILADSLDSQNAGIHIFTKSLVEELALREDEHEYILIRQKLDKKLPQHIKQIEVKNISIPGYAPLRLFATIPRILARLNVDIVFEPAHFGPFNLPKDIIRTTFIHDLTPIIFKEHHKPASQILQRIFLPRILKNTNYIFTNSKNTSKDLELHYPFTKNKNKSIYLGRNERFKPTYDENALQVLGLNNPYFLSVGTIEPRKNLSTLLEAFCQYLDKTNRNTLLVIAGGLGWKSEAFEQQYQNHKYKKNIIRLGYVKDEVLPILYTHAMALVYPSLYEGFGFPVLEAMSCGTPVICSDNSSMPEVGGDIAYYIDPNTSSDLATQLDIVANLTKNQRVEIKKRSITRAALFTWKKFADEFIFQLEKLKRDFS